MKKRTGKYGLTLIEILVVMAIIAILTAITIGAARRIDNQSKERLTENTIAIIKTALGQFEDYKYDYNDVDYRGFVFPLDCNDYAAFATTLEDAMGLVPGSITIAGGTHDPSYSGCEVMYFLLSQIPECRKTLDRVDKSLITNKGSNGLPMSITIGSSPIYPLMRIIDPLMRIIDPWKTTLRYDYYNEEPPIAIARARRINRMWDSRRTFPVVISAGADRIFGTSDDIKSR